jgi:hypothetical protein
MAKLRSQFAEMLTDMGLHRVGLRAGGRRRHALARLGNGGGGGKGNGGGAADMARLRELRRRRDRAAGRKVLTGVCALSLGLQHCMQQ